jgi:hypothetical protein
MSTKSDTFGTEESDETDTTQLEIDAHRREELLEQTRINQAAGALVQLSNEPWNADQGNTEKEDDEAKAMDASNEVELDVQDEDMQTEDDRTEESDDSSEEDSETRKESRK